MKRSDFLSYAGFAALGYGCVTLNIGSQSRLATDLYSEVVTVSISEISSAIEKIIVLADGAVQANGNELKFKVNGQDQRIVFKTI